MDEAEVARILGPCRDRLLSARFRFVRKPPREAQAPGLPRSREGGTSASRWPLSPLRKPLAPQSILFASERGPRRVVRVSAYSALGPGLLAAGPARNKLTPNRLARGAAVPGDRCRTSGPAGRPCRSREVSPTPHLFGPILVGASRRTGGRGLEPVTAWTTSGGGSMARTAASPRPAGKRPCPPRPGARPSVSIIREVVYAATYPLPCLRTCPASEGRPSPGRRSWAGCAASSRSRRR